MWLYLTAWLYDQRSATCGARAEALETVSHDRLTRLLRADGSGPTLLEHAFRTLFVWEQGSLLLDDTVVPKPFAPALEGLAGVFSSQERRLGYGFSLVRLVWTAGIGRRPLGLRLGRKGGHRSKPWRWSCAAMRAPACAAAQPPSSSTPGLRRGLS